MTIKAEPMLKEGALKGKTILVTGGGTGLGRSMVKYFLELGANVVICSRKLEVLQEAARELEQETGGTVLPLACDVRKYLEIETVLKTAIGRFGRVDALVNNAAGNFVSPTERLSPKAFDVVTDIVLKGSYNCTLALGKHWIEQKQAGTVLNIVTTYAWTGSGYVVPSACAKAGVLALTRSLASEWAKYGIRSNAIAPGPFPTEGAWTRLFPKQLADKIDPVKRIPVGRFGEHQELANLAAYLVSDYASFVNGEVVTIDGGEWLYGAGEFNSFDQVPQEMWDALEKQMRGKGKPE
ncbi:NAD(P)-dependent dehydrogenase (short-subunit alcohol dehydrogenase family) [Pontibacter ummariensis]|uniref:NAD(P)-dependent dehydrogenase, short-chain alcohol dehydrogenase family n=1 Tax=Pontibacter ummariensis TaxID=1610492 RepID=A0A239FQL4_9BACT|nr:SDR family oxidoreductase [Pontibacter ummariensis]PRY12000.1 NAD(P)-dependent dehydrogenase (short-subunit alcohol dehydrogenase family) [Pontibacter ummariensis]SNS58194.1 NAD(P)-dependent dehydrogenase, short-chain alcohol dehydrogenase family [Pontibacter ummariensis]